MSVEYNHPFWLRYLVGLGMNRIYVSILQYAPNRESL